LYLLDKFTVRSFALDILYCPKRNFGQELSSL